MQTTLAAAPSPAETLKIREPADRFQRRSRRHRLMVFSACVPVTRVHQIQPCRAKADPACRGCLAAKGGHAGCHMDCRAHEQHRHGWHRVGGRLSPRSGVWASILRPPSRTPVMPPSSRSIFSPDALRSLVHVARGTRAYENEAYWRPETVRGEAQMVVSAWPLTAMHILEL